MSTADNTLENEPAERNDAGVAEHTAKQQISDCADECGGDAESTDPSFEKQLQAALAERDSNLDKLSRAQAELENYRRRVQKELEEDRRYRALSVIRDLLPALDNLQRAIQAAENSNNVEELVQGVKMVAAQFDGILANHSAVPIEAVDQPFDPSRHEAIQQLASPEHAPMTVLQELERGYMLHERVVRPSKVIVSCAPPDEDAAEQEGEASDEHKPSN